MDINLKANWQGYLVAVLVILAGIFAAAAIYYYHLAYKSDQLVKAAVILQNPKAPVITRYVDKLKQNHAEIVADDNDIPVAALTQVADRKGLIDTLKEALNISNVKQIEELTRQIMELKSRVKLKPVTDSNGRKSMNYSDKWLNFDYNPADSIVNLSYNATLTAVKYHKNSWIPFAKSVSYIDFYGDDPRLKINGVSHFRVMQPQPLFGFTADAKTTFLIYSKRLVPSFGADLRVGNFNFEAREYFNKQFKPLISAGYKFVNF